MLPTGRENQVKNLLDNNKCDTVQLCVTFMPSTLWKPQNGYGSNSRGTEGYSNGTPLDDPVRNRQKHKPHSIDFSSRTRSGGWRGYRSTARRTGVTRRTTGGLRPAASRTFTRRTTTTTTTRRPVLTDIGNSRSGYTQRPIYGTANQGYGHGSGVTKRPLSKAEQNFPGAPKPYTIVQELICYNGGRQDVSVGPYNYWCDN